MLFLFHILQIISSLLQCYILSDILPHLGITVSALTYRLLTHVCILRILWKSSVQNCNPHPKLRNGYFYIPNYSIRIRKFKILWFYCWLQQNTTIISLYILTYCCVKTFCLWIKPVRTALTFPSGSSTNPSISVAVIFPKCPIWPFSLRPVNVLAIFQNLAKRYFRDLKHSITSSYST